MSQLSAEAEQAILKYNLNISNQTRSQLVSMNDDPDRQTKWVVNPVMQFFIERAMNQMLGNRSVVPSSSVPSNSIPSVSIPTSESKPIVVEEPEEEVGLFSLFD